MCYGVGICIIDKIDLLINYKLFKFLCEWGFGFKIFGNNLFIFFFNFVNNYRILEIYDSYC